MENAIFEASALEMAGLTVSLKEFLAQKVTAYPTTLLD